MYKIEEASHYLKCKHCIGKNCVEYLMKCKILHKTKSGKIKIVVFGDRNWIGKDHIYRIRYVYEYKLAEI